MKNLILLAVQGAGKGTLAKALKEKGICLKKEKMEKLVDDIESQLENV